MSDDGLIARGAGATDFSATSAGGAAASLPADVAALVAAEVERQVAPLRAELESALAELRERTPEDRASLVVFSGDLDRVLAAFVIATGAAAAGLETSVFFTFWGLSAVKSKSASAVDKGLKQRLFTLMTPGSSEGLGTSKLNFFGLGATMLRSMMAEQGIASLEELMGMARDLGVKLTACTMSMDAMGVVREELIDDIEIGGVAAFLGEASRSRFTLFI